MRIAGKMCKRPSLRCAVSRLASSLVRAAAGAACSPSSRVSRSAIPPRCVPHELFGGEAGGGTRGAAPAGHQGPAAVGRLAVRPAGEHCPRAARHAAELPRGGPGGVARRAGRGGRVGVRRGWRRDRRRRPELGRTRRPARHDAVAGDARAGAARDWQPGVRLGGPGLGSDKVRALPGARRGKGPHRLPQHSGRRPGARLCLRCAAEPLPRPRLVGAAGAADGARDARVAARPPERARRQVRTSPSSSTSSSPLLPQSPPPASAQCPRVPPPLPGTRRERSKT